MICANLDRLEVYVGGAHFATVTPDTAGYPDLATRPRSPTSARSTAHRGRNCGSTATLARSRSRPARWPPTHPVTCCRWPRTTPKFDGDGMDETRLEFRAVDRYG